MKDNTRILWLSRHTFTPEQLADLKRIYGEDIEIIQYDKTIENIAQIENEIQDADVIAAVLSVELLRDLVKVAGAKPVIVAKSSRIPAGERVSANGTVEREFKFVHKHWEQIKKLEMETVILG